MAVLSSVAMVMFPLTADYVGIIGALGFPIFVSLWFMYRIEKILNNNTKAMQELIRVVEELCKEVQP